MEPESLGLRRSRRNHLHPRLGHHGGEVHWDVSPTISGAILGSHALCVCLRVRNQITTMVSKRETLFGMFVYWYYVFLFFGAANMAESGTGPYQVSKKMVTGMQ